MDAQEATQIAVTANETFETFYAREYPSQIRRAVLLLGSEADATDAVAHAFTNIFAKWGELDAPGSYLNRSVLNACRDVGRRRKHLTIVSSSAEVAIPINDPRAPDNNTASSVILNALLALPYKQRAVVVLKHYVGLSETEIADQLDIATGSVGPTLFRAHKQLKTTLKEFA